MKKIDIISITAIVIYVIFIYSNIFVNYSLLYSSGEFAELLFILWPIVLLYAVIWYILFLMKRGVSAKSKISFSIFFFAVPFVFTNHFTNPICLGVRYLNDKLGGNARLIEWADKIFEMPLQDVTEQDYTQGVSFYIKDSLKRDIFPDDLPWLASILVEDNKKTIIVQYQGRSGVLFGDKELIKKYHQLPMYENDGLYIWWSPK